MEALVAVAVMSIVLLVLVNAYQGAMKALTSSRIKKQVTQFAQSELQRYVAYSRMPRRHPDGSLNPDPSTGLQVPEGYNQIVSQAERQAHYPEELMGSESASFSKERFLFNRVLTVNTVNAGQADEHKVVKVVLSDTLPNPRFSPIEMETKIRKPDPAALDLRQAVDVGSLVVQALDSSPGNPPISLSNNPRVQLTGTSVITQPLPESGSYNFINLVTNIVYQLYFYASNYWPETRSDVTLSAGANTLPTVLLQPVYSGTVTVDVIDNDSELPLEGVRARIDYPSGFPPQPPHGPSVNSAYDPMTNPSGRATQAIPIPARGVSTFSGFRLYNLSKTNYFTEYPAAPITLSRFAAASFGPYRMYRYKSGVVRVRAQDAGGIPVPGAQVQAIDLGSEGGIILATNWDSDSDGAVELTVRTNFPGNAAAKTTSSRNVAIVVRRVLYQLRRVTQMVAADETRDLTVTLAPDQMIVSMNPASAAPELDRVGVPQGSSREFQAQTRYYGHSGNGNNFEGSIDILTFTPGGFSPISRNWTWVLQDNDKGYTTPPSPASSNTSDRITFTAGISANGNTQLDMTATYNFQYNGGNVGATPIGPATGPQTRAVAATAFIRIDPAVGGTPELAVTISGPSSMQPSESEDFAATATFGTNPLPPDLTYSWSLAGPGELPADPDERTVELRAGDSSHLGQTMTLTVTVFSASLGRSATASLPVTIAFPELTVSLPCSDSISQLGPYSEFEVEPSVSGGSGNYAYAWMLVNPVDGTELGASSPAGNLVSSLDNRQARFQSNVTGSVRLRLQVSDSVSGARAADQFCDINVQPSGASGG
ncbi:MAG: hypothetical protein HY549_07350 [Elusimicrobia bacterium]|nr:hypothetical protein [Elusimicrobiota bacterium]